MPLNLLLTDPRGCIGKNLLAALPDGIQAHLALPDNLILAESPYPTLPLSQIGQQSWGPDWAILHMAAEQQEQGGRRLKKFNTELTLHLAQKAIAEGAREFIFLSALELSFLPKERIQQNPYLMSKYLAERGLSQLFKERPRTRLTILRVPMVYGPLDQESHYSLFRLASRKVRLPLAKVNAKISRLYVGNLVSALTTLLQTPQPNAAARYELADTDALSLGEFYQVIFSHYQPEAALSNWPLWIFRGIARCLGWLEKLPLFYLPLGAEEMRGFLEDRLAQGTAFAQAFGWEPPFSCLEGLEKTITWYREFDQISTE